MKRSLRKLLKKITRWSIDLIALFFMGFFVICLIPVYLVDQMVEFANSPDEK